MASISDIYAAINSAVQAISRLNVTVASVFPSATGSSSFITSTGTVTFNSSQPVGFLSVATSSGAIVKLPYFS